MARHGKAWMRKYGAKSTPMSPARSKARRYTSPNTSERSYSPSPSSSRSYSPAATSTRSYGNYPGSTRKWSPATAEDKEFLKRMKSKGK